MEEILINIDSKYRNILINPNEAKFRYNLEKTYKNIISARMISIEINNSVSYIDSEKANNYITLHLPNKLNDPIGTKLELDEGLYQVVGIIQNALNGLFEELFNTNSGLQTTYIDNKIFAEKYFYFFYLNENIEFNFDFNALILPSSLSTKLIIKSGWHSIYGLVLQISNYITDKYNERLIYKIANPSTPIIDLDSGNFMISLITLPIFDRRFRSILGGNPTIYDCIRYDNIPSQTFNTGNLINNLSLLKTYIYQIYINDITTFIPQTSSTYGSYILHGILDNLYSGEYIIPVDPLNTSFGNLSPNYIFSGNKLLSKSIYYLNKTQGETPSIPSNNSCQIYNLLMQTDLTSLKVSFNNFFTITSFKTSCEGSNYAFYYYYISPLGINQTWNNAIDDIPNNQFDTLFTDKKFLRDQVFITQTQYDNPFFKYTSEKDIAEFEIDFSTYKLESSVINGLIDIKKLNYPPVGYYLGYRPDLTKSSDNFIFSGIIDGTERLITASKIFNTTGDNYLFLKINDWGYFDFFSQKLFAKVLLTTGLGNPKIEDYVNKEFRFRQPININKLDIELVDYLGNTVQLGGFNWSFTLELKQIVNSSDKNDIERKTLVFNNVYNK
jgi:hypothetical protein